jgi:hypothetical protein
LKFAYFTIHAGKNPPPQNGCRLKSIFFSKAPVSHPHFPNSTGLFTKPTGRHYTKYWFSLDIGMHGISLNMLLAGSYKEKININSNIALEE